ncbi:MerR family transcriptional regulator [Microbulbifer sp. OS29]|uniref:MerR family transcriptional regulator n=1 Tax=Microbulbifer okhotskensis TaxID=2926617 RepID=A0A9X2EQG0_9GAMM|nr:MerR family transcriptional regulator [Microbulbifer okhotskensis]MCO1336574.1 MerR family transcriptional regulator [Microbulbifer okhotskensis]
MLTVTELARRCHVSRATILYYERTGILSPTQRSENGYRWYGDEEIRKLEAIVAYRSYGLSLDNIKGLLDRHKNSSQSSILKDHFYQLEGEIHKLKEQQKAIVALLQEPSLLDGQMMTKNRWIAIMEAAGFDQASMFAWHHKFEQMEPEQHQKFLESLGMESEEIRKTRTLKP